MSARIVEELGGMRLVYQGTLDGRHEFFLECKGDRGARVNLGPLSLESAKAALLERLSTPLDDQHPCSTGDVHGAVERLR